LKILILNGPNLNLLGTREPDIYGDKTMDEVIGALRLKFPNTELFHLQTNHEGVMIDKIQEVGFSYDGIILNAGGYTHTSVALGDAVNAVTTPVVELHISDIYNREAFRQHSYIKPYAVHQIIGKGTAGYEEAVSWLLQHEN